MTTRREMVAGAIALTSAAAFTVTKAQAGIFRIAVLGDYEGMAAKAPWHTLGSDADVEFFGKPFESPEATVKALQGFHATVLMRERTPLPRTVIERLPQLKLIVFTGPSDRTLDYAAAVERHIAVCFAMGGDGRRPTPPSIGGDPPAELALALMLACARNVPAADALVRRGGWAFQAGTALRGKVLGIAGYGNLGEQVGRYGIALGMRVMGWSRSLTDERALTNGITRADRDTLMRTSDVLSIHLPLTPATTGIIGTNEINSMKPGAILINTARAAIVDQAAMIDALRARRIAMAGLDVFDEEPLPKRHPLLQLSNVVLTPHIGYSIGPELVNMYSSAIEVVAAFRQGIVRNRYTPAT